MTLAIDGSASISSWTNTTPKTISLTTSLANDVVIVVVGIEGTSPVAHVTSVTCTGLTFTKRSSQVEAGTTGSGQATIEMWWAPASAALSAATISVAISGTFDDGILVAFGVNGAANINSPWDSNGALPASQDFTTSTSAPSTTISTTSASSLLIAVAGGAVAGGLTAPSGFTMIGAPGNSGGALFYIANVAYKIVSAPVSSQTETFSSGTAGKFVTLGDAITSVGASATGRPVVFVCT